MKQIIEKAKNIRLLILDVDGTMTDGKITYCEDGKEIKSFDVKDGHGIFLLISNGIDVAIISSRFSGVVEKRARELGIKHVYQGELNKLAVYVELIKKMGISDTQVGYVGDDIMDIPLLLRAGLSVTVPDGVSEVKKVVDYVTKKKGGEGAVREVCDLILKAQNKWSIIISGL